MPSPSDIGIQYRICDQIFSHPQIGMYLKDSGILRCVSEMDFKPDVASVTILARLQRSETP